MHLFIYQLTHIFLIISHTEPKKKRKKHTFFFSPYTTPYTCVLSFYAQQLLTFFHSCTYFLFLCFFRWVPFSQWNKTITAFLHSVFSLFQCTPLSLLLTTATTRCTVVWYDHDHTRTLWLYGCACVPLPRYYHYYHCHKVTEKRH